MRVAVVGAEAFSRAAAWASSRWTATGGRLAGRSSQGVVGEEDDARAAVVEAEAFSRAASRSTANAGYFAVAAAATLVARRCAGAVPVVGAAMLTVECAGGVERGSSGSVRASSAMAASFPFPSLNRAPERER